ncbi:MAG: hypothetical protein M3498_05635 [Deinococcota bacterium]|nr:hypothetical protein [Deinococcota bacterium]
MNGLELQRIRLLEANASTGINVGAPIPAQSSLSIDSETDYEATKEGFEARQRYVFVITDKKTDRESGRIEAEYGLLFKSDFSAEVPNFKEYFGIFSEVNLPVNVWPFMREFVQTTLSRMDWSPFTLPLLKPPSPEPKPKATKQGRKRKTE